MSNGKPKTVDDVSNKSKRSRKNKAVAVNADSLADTEKAEGTKESPIPIDIKQQSANAEDKEVKAEIPAAVATSAIEDKLEEKLRETIGVNGGDGGFTEVQYTSAASKKKKTANQRPSKKLASLKHELNDDEFPKLSERSSNQSKKPATKPDNSSSKTAALKDSANGLADFDYPSLGSVTRPPPGLTNTTAPKSKPPGLSSSKLKAAPRSGPPPGLAEVSLMSLANLLDGSTPTSDSHSYIEPLNFPQRNKKLSFRLRELIYNDVEKFHQFKNLSKDFRCGEITAQDFYRGCDKLLGERVLSEILPELVAFLPDIGKQQQLYALCRDRVQKSQHKSSQWNAISDTSLSVCDTCQQVLMSMDVSQHQAEHGVGIDDFPTISNMRKSKHAWAN